MTLIFYQKYTNTQIHTHTGVAPCFIFFLLSIFFFYSFDLNTGDDCVLDTDTLQDTPQLITPLLQQRSNRRQHLSSRLAEINREYEDSNQLSDFNFSNSNSIIDS